MENLFGGAVRQKIALRGFGSIERGVLHGVVTLVDRVDAVDCDGEGAAARPEGRHVSGQSWLASGFPPAPTPGSNTVREKRALSDPSLA